MTERLHNLVPALAIAVSGLCLLLALALVPRADAPAFGILVPPWASPGEGVAAVASLAVPIADIRAGGRLIVIMPVADVDGPGGRAGPQDWRRALPRGHILIAAPGASCASGPIATGG